MSDEKTNEASPTIDYNELMKAQTAAFEEEKKEAIATASKVAEMITPILKAILPDTTVGLVLLCHHGDPNKLSIITDHKTSMVGESMIFTSAAFQRQMTEMQHQATSQVAQQMQDALNEAEAKGAEHGNAN